MRRTPATESDVALSGAKERAVPEVPKRTDAATTPTAG